MHKRFILSLLLALSLCLGACEEGSSKGGPTVAMKFGFRLAASSPSM